MADDYLRPQDYYSVISSTYISKPDDEEYLGLQNIYDDVQDSNIDSDTDLSGSCGNKQPSNIYTTIQKDDQSSQRCLCTRQMLIICLIILAFVVCTGTAGVLGWYFGSRSRGECYQL